MTNLFGPNGQGSAVDAGLPEAQCAKRWQPVRGGLINVFRFDYEEFQYEQGRLLLRGNNGTGKSRVLALQLPFLLDGEISSHRVEPDGDPAKRMEWNLLLDKYPDRIGYTWIEFGQRLADGTCRYLTLGCGLHAVQGRGIHARWFFITTQRVGGDLFLLNAARQPLGKNRLEEELTGRGTVYLSAEAYRRGVDDALFKLGDRYPGLVDLLIQLRQPQLSRKLDEQRLSDALSQALPPLAVKVITDVADAFRSLEAERDQLAEFQAAMTAVTDFLDDYRRYAQIAARRRAEGVRKTHSEYEERMRRLRQAEAEQHAAQADLAAAEARLSQLAAEQSAAQAAVETLVSSPEMRSADHLARARQLAAERAQAAERAEADQQRAGDARSAAEAERDAEANRASGAAERAQRSYDEARLAAIPLGLAAELETAVAHYRPGPDVGEQGPAQADRDLQAAVARRQMAADHLHKLDQKVHQAQRHFELAAQAHDQLEGQVQQALESQRQAADRVELAAHRAIEAYRAWAAKLQELVPADADELEEHLSAWQQTGDGAGPITASVEAAAASAHARLAQAEAATQQRLLAAHEEREHWRAEHSRLSAGYHVPPPPPYTRAPEQRAARAGAPLWELCDFLPDVSPERRAGFEAALEASGLLDAWITPDGRLLAADEHDTLLLAGASPLPPEDQHLGRVLAAAIDRGNPRAAAVSEDAVAAVLRHIGLSSSAGAAWVDAAGRWQLGPLHGSWSKPAAQHIGQSAREAERRRRLSEAAAALAEAEQMAAAVERELEHIHARQLAVDNEAGSAPDESPIRAALADLQASGRQADQSRQQLVEAEHVLNGRRGALNDATVERQRDARDLGVAAWIGETLKLGHALAGLSVTLASLWPSLRGRQSAAEQAAAAAKRAVLALAEEQHRRQRFESERQAASAAAAERDTLQAAIGAAAAEIESRLAEARDHVAQVRNDHAAATEARFQAAGQHSAATANITSFQELLDSAAARRDEKIAELARLIATGLLAVASAEFTTLDAEGWSPTKAVEAARQVEAALVLVGMDEAAWERIQKEIHRHLEELKEALLAHHYSPEVSVEDTILVVTVPFQGRACTMDALEQALAAEIQQRQTILNAREREVLEKHLIGEVATQLHDLLHSAERLVLEMNAELAARPTSTGMRLRFNWEPLDDGPPGLIEARRRLLGTQGTWSLEERTALADFLQQRIQAVRDENQSGTWQEHLAAALDYRRWHRFGVERQQDGQWKRLTRRTYGTGSGGEKAITLTIPQFAAAAAHYRTADPQAPRLILLDEAFVGVDPNMRSKCLDLLCAFDLDVVMTSEHEWGCYPTVPGLAIYQLSTRPEIDAIGVTRWVWNGRQRLRDSTPPPSPFPPSATHPAATSNPSGNGNGAPHA